jgi:hypothetical protein
MLLYTLLRIFGCVACFILLLTILEQLSIHYDSSVFRPSIGLTVVAVKSKLAFITLGEYLGIVSSVFIYVKNLVYKYSLKFIPSLKAILFPLWEIMTSPVYVIKGWLATVHDIIISQWSNPDPIFTHHGLNVVLLCIGLAMFCGILYYFLSDRIQPIVNWTIDRYYYYYNYDNNVLAERIQQVGREVHEQTEHTRGAIKGTVRGHYVPHEE